MAEVLNDTGSMADVPKDLLDQIKRLEELFTVPNEKLLEITNHFVKELKKGEFDYRILGHRQFLMPTQVSLWKAVVL